MIVFSLKSSLKPETLLTDWGYVSQIIPILA